MCSALNKAQATWTESVPEPTEVTQSDTGAGKGPGCEYKITAFPFFSFMRVPCDHKESKLIRIKDCCHLSSTCLAKVSSQATFTVGQLDPRQGGRAELWVRGMMSYI